MAPVQQTTGPIACSARASTADSSTRSLRSERFPAADALHIEQVIAQVRFRPLALLRELTQEFLKERGVMRAPATGKSQRHR
jgi:hypothetical protein